MKHLLLLSTLLTSNLWAGTITLKGISNIGKSPDYIELSIKTTAKCFETVVDSNKAVEQKATELTEKIKEHISLDLGDQLVLTAGLSKREDVIRYINGDRDRRVVVCEKGWESSRNIIVRFADLSAFERLNPDLLEIVDSIGTNANDRNGFLEIVLGSPLPKLTPESKSEMESTALKEALVNASNKFRGVRSLCSLINVKIENMVEASPVMRDYRDNSVPTGGLSFELQYVHLAWKVTWSFESSSGECVASK